MAGEVVALGPGIKRLRPGDRVALNNVVGCGACPACRAGNYVMCPNWDGSRDVNGGFAELVLAPERNCLKLDEAIDYETGCLLFDNWGTPFSALEKAGVKNGDDVVVSGCGPIGLGAVGLARLRGVFVIAVDPLPSRQQTAVQMGAEVALAPGADLPAAVRQHTSGLGAHFVIECSGRGAAYPLGLAALRHGGTLVSVGEEAKFELHPSDVIIRRALRILGSWYSSMAQGRQVQDLVLQNKINPKVLVSHRAPLAEFPRLFQQVCEQPETVTKAVIINR